MVANTPPTWRPAPTLAEEHVADALVKVGLIDAVEAAQVRDAEEPG